MEFRNVNGRAYAGHPNDVDTNSLVLLHDGAVYNRLIPYGSGGSKILQNEVGNPDQNDVTIAAACNFL